MITSPTGVFSKLLGVGEDSFYAEPPIEHLDIWRSPHLSPGYWIHPATDGIPEHHTQITAAEFINTQLGKLITNV